MCRSSYSAGIGVVDEEVDPGVHAGGFDRIPVEDFADFCRPGTTSRPGVDCTTAGVPWHDFAAAQGEHAAAQTLYRFPPRCGLEAAPCSTAAAMPVEIG